MNKLEWYPGATYSDIYQPEIMTNTLVTFPNPKMPTIMTDTGTKRPKTDVKMTYSKEKNINEANRLKI